MYRYYYISSFLVFFAFSSVFSQTEIDTSVVIRTYILNHNTLSLENDSYDSSFNAAYSYNTIFKQNFSNTFLGNTGQAAIPNEFYKRGHNHPFLFATPLQLYFYNPYNIQHFNTRKPFTEIKYLSSGSKDNSEQILSALHTQNINKNTNIGLLYDLIASKGLYPDQNVGVNRINLFGSYNKDNYGFYTSVQYNGHKTQENGGLYDVQEFVDQKTDVLNYRMLLEDTDSKTKNLNLFFTQKLNLAAIAKDSATEEIFDNFALHHTLNYERYVRTYTDIISEYDSLNYYVNDFSYKNQANDSAYYQNLSNRFDLSVNMAKESQEFRAYIKHEFKTFAYRKPSEIIYASDLPIDTIYNTSSRERFNDISVGGQFLGELNSWKYTLNGHLYLTGYNIGDVYAEAIFEKHFKNERVLSLNAVLESYKPSYFLNKYSSAHFIWNNNFEKTEGTKLSLQYKGKKRFNSRFTLSVYNDYVYMDKESLPQQYGPEFVVAGLYLDKNFKLGPFYSQHKILAQKSTTKIISLPVLAYNNKSYFQGDVFKKALYFQIGGEFYYYTKYYGDAYMAALGNFYSQNNEKIGNYPFITGFVNLKIKNVRLTLQYTNVLDGLVDANYFMAYRYPGFGGSFKFGLAWTFYD